MNKITQGIAFVGFSLVAMLSFYPSTAQQNEQFNKVALQHEELPNQAKKDKALQRVTVTIDGGYKPSKVTVKVGKPVELTFVRKDSSSCTEVVVIKALGFRKSIPTGKSVKFRFTPKKVGEIGFECGMGMVKGKIVVTRA